MQRLKSVRTNGLLGLVTPAKQDFRQPRARDLLRRVESLKEEIQAVALWAETVDESKGLELGPGNDFYASVRRFEIAMIKRALELTEGSQTRAAALLRIKVTTLNSKIKRYKI